MPQRTRRPTPRSGARLDPGAPARPSARTVRGAPSPTRRGGDLMPRDVLSIVLAGGEGKRLAPLTADRAKPAVPFGGVYRLIDFALSNLVNADFRKIVVLTQYKSHSLDRHVSLTWQAVTAAGQLRDPGARPDASRPALVRRFRRRDLSELQPDPRRASGPHHRARSRPHLPHGPCARWSTHHIRSGAAVTVAGIRAPIEQASEFGVIETAQDGERIVAFREKPREPEPLPDAPGEVYASMGNYVFTADALIEAVTTDAKDALLQARHRRQHHPDARRARRGTGVRLRDQRGARRHPTRDRATGATSGRSTPTTTRTRT